MSEFHFCSQARKLRSFYLDYGVKIYTTINNELILSIYFQWLKKYIYTIETSGLFIKTYLTRQESRQKHFNVS